MQDKTTLDQSVDLTLALREDFVGKKLKEVVQVIVRELNVCTMNI